MQSLTKNQTRELLNEKGKLQVQCEQQSNELKNIAKKVQRELEEKYGQEIEDLRFICDSLKKENETILNFQTSDVERKSGKEKKKVVGGGSAACRECKAQKKRLQEYSEQLTTLMDSKYALEQKVEWLECQQKIQSGSQESKIIQEKYNELSVFERRMNQVKDQVLFWKDKASKLSVNYMSILANLKKENSQLKTSLQNNQKQFFSECEKLIREFTALHYQESLDLKGQIRALTEKVNEKHRIITDLRGRVHQKSQGGEPAQSSNKENSAKEANKKKKKRPVLV